MPFVLGPRRVGFGKIPPLLKNTLQSKILQVNKISISFPKKKKKIVLVRTVSFNNIVFSNLFKMKFAFQNEPYIIWQQSTKID